MANVKVRLYILCYDECSVAAAKKQFPENSWTCIVQIPVTPFMHHAAYRSWFLEHAGEWEELDYIGAVPWSTVNNGTIPDVSKLEAFLSTKKPDFYAPAKLFDDMVHQAQQCHPQFTSILCQLAHHMGFESDVEGLKTHKIPFFTSPWFLKRDLFHKFCTFMDHACSILEVDLHDLVWQDAKHAPIDLSECAQFFNREYYPHHPFVAERLIFYFLWRNVELICYGNRSEYKRAPLSILNRDKDASGLPKTVSLTVKNEVDALIYILSYNEVTYKYAETKYFGPWFKPIIIETTKYLESTMYACELEKRRAEWEHKRYVGTLSYKAQEKVRLPNLDVLWPLIQAEDPDVVAFMGTTDNLIRQAQSSHPRFREIWVVLLELMGYERNDILSPHVPAYFCNYWMAKPSWMEKYMDFFDSAMRFIEQSPKLQELMQLNSGYKGKIDVQRCREIFGKSYYIYHPFVCERLSNFFFWKHGAKIRYVEWARPPLVKRGMKLVGSNAFRLAAFP